MKSLTSPDYSWARPSGTTKTQRHEEESPARVRCGCSPADPKLLLDQFAEGSRNLSVPRNGRLASGVRVPVDVVPPSVTIQMTSGRGQFANEVLPLHTRTSISAAPGGGGSSVSIII
jgi:hypothetical protein